VYSFYRALSDNLSFDVDGVMAHGSEATASCILMGLILAALAGPNVWLLVLHYTARRSVAIRPDGLVLPKSRWSSKKLTISYGSITSISLANGNFERVITINHSGASVDIADICLPHTYDLEAICRLLNGRVACEVPLVEDVKQEGNPVL
jgi:hypothetical protein